MSELRGFLRGFDFVGSLIPGSLFVLVIWTAVQGAAWPQNAAEYLAWLSLGLVAGQALSFGASILFWLPLRGTSGPHLH